MNIAIVQFLLAAAAIVAALSVAAICVVGLIVWLAGGKMAQRKDEETA